MQCSSDDDLLVIKCPRQTPSARGHIERGHLRCNHSLVLILLHIVPEEAVNLRIKDLGEPLSRFVAPYVGRATVRRHETVAAAIPDDACLCWRHVGSLTLRSYLDGSRDLRDGESSIWLSGLARALDVPRATVPYEVLSQLSCALQILHEGFVLFSLTTRADATNNKYTFQLE